MSELPVVPLKSLPLYQNIDKSDLWYGMVPELLDIQHGWIKKHSVNLNLDKRLQPYFEHVTSVLTTSIIVAGNGHQYFAVYALRAILERVALFWTALPSSGIDTNNILTELASDDLKARKLASQTIMDFAESKDKAFKLLHAMLSRYFGHVSHLDTIRINQEVPKDQLLATRSMVLPLLLIFDVGLCLVKVVEELLKSQNKTPAPLTAGRNNQYTAKGYLRTAAYVMCEKHSKNQGIPLRTLYNNIQNVSGQIGITNIYRGGMEVFRYGSPDEKPSISDIAGFSLFAVGKAKANDIRVKIIKEDEKGEQYQVSWPKWFEIDATAISTIATQNNNKLFPLFDYVTDFIEAVEDHETLKISKNQNS